MAVTQAEFGARVRARRKAAKLSQKKLAELIGMERAHLTRIEGGAHAPGLDLLNRIAQALKVDLGELIGNGHPKPKRNRHAA